MREPFGERETHSLLANLIVIVGNALRGKGSKAIRHDDVMPGRRKARKDLAQSARTWLGK